MVSLVVALGWSVGRLTFRAIQDNAIAGLLADRFGRKTVLLAGTAVITVSLFTNAWTFHTATYEL